MIESVTSFVTACLAAGFVVLAASVFVSSVIEAWRGGKR